MDSITQNPSTQTDDADEDPLLKASMATLNLYKIRDTFYPKNPDDKISKLQQDSQYCLNLLDSIPPEFRKSAIQRATYEHLKGKVLDVFPDYRKEAEDHLSKAGPDKNVLCQLSMLERKMAQDSDNKAELVDESIRHAKEAIALDVADGNSWSSTFIAKLFVTPVFGLPDNLGNACLTSFFASGAWDHSKLCQSLKAYQNAEKDEMMKGNPDLYFNCATVNKYLENYDKALNGFEAACKIDPALNASGEIQKMVGLLDKLESLLKGHIKAKRLASLVSSLVPVEANLSYKKATIDLLFEGLNKSTAVTGKVLFYVKHDNVAPLYYVACDSNQMCFVLSVYGIQDNVIREGDQITLLEPWFKNVNFSWKGKHYSFKSIRADFKEQVMVNGKALSANQAISTSFYAQHKPT
uniref:Tetratricopeptide repeat protein 5 OB fold domain-containing protein n=1 Tax=Chenopodium quinoa TaxID=63459 RepID=A0A803N2Z6_CHEQI